MARYWAHIQQYSATNPFARSSGRLMCSLSKCILPFLSTVRVVAVPVAASTAKSTGLQRTVLALCDGCVLTETCPVACTSSPHHQSIIQKVIGQAHRDFIALYVSVNSTRAMTFSSLGARHHELVLGSWICLTGIGSAGAAVTNVIAQKRLPGNRFASSITSF